MSSHNLATTIYNLSINWLDDQLSNLISKQENNSLFIVICIYALKLCPTCIEELLPSELQSQPDFNINKDNQLILELKKLTTNPIYKTKQILDTLRDADLALIIIKYSFLKLETIIDEQVRMIYLSFLVRLTSMLIQNIHEN